MDYCHPCRRHLNGALACAGCGTPAEALGPFAVPAPTLSGHAPHEAADVPAPTASRPRQRARGGHRRRGRTVLLAVGGLVLAAGALSLAERAMEPDRDGTAADFVQEAPHGPGDPVPDSASGGAPQDPGPVTSGGGRTVAPSPSGSATADGPTRTPAPDASTTAPTASPSPDDATSPGPTPDSSDSPPADPPDSEATEEPPTAPAPPQPDDPTETPTPTPTPSPTCTRFLWWCT